MSQISILLALILAAMVLFTLEWLPVEVVTLLLLVLLHLTGILTPEEAFSGFANEILFILGSVFVLSGALVKTGVMDWLAHTLARFAGASESRLVLAIMALSAAMSAFFNNTNTTAILMPSSFELSRRSGISPSRLLMPLAFASILGGTCTLIGTSTNVAASGLIQKLGLEPFALFEFTAVGLTVVVAGIAYMALVGYRFIPERVEGELGEKYAIEKYLAGLSIPEGSQLAGHVVSDRPLGDRDIIVLAIVRGRTKIFPHPSTRMEVGDLLIVHASRKALLAAKESGDVKFEADEPVDPTTLVDDMKLIEAFVMPSSSLTGRSLRELDFRQRYGLSVLAVHRHGHQMASDIRDLRLEVGDVLLLQGEEEQLRPLHENRELWPLEDVPHVPHRRRKGKIALAALLGAFTLSAGNIMPLAFAMLLGALAVVILRCITPEEVYAFVEWRLLILIAGMTAVGLAMQKTGADVYLSGLIINWAEPFGLIVVMATFAVLTMVLTQPLSNAAAALVVLPVAISTAVELGVNPRTFAVLVTLSASLSFITPFEPACLLVYGPGGYRFRDFVKSGAVLSAIALVVLLLLVPWIWPL